MRIEDLQAAHEKEDDAERAIRAGLAIIDSLGKPQSVSVQARIGIASGVVVVGDLVREGVSWIQFLGSAPFRQSIVVTSGLNAGYGATTTPQQATISATLQLSVDVTNYGQRTWTPGLFSLSYHVFSANGSTILWDGARGALPTAVSPGTTVSVPINVALPGTTGDYVLAWDMVQEGVAWFSQLGVQRKAEAFSIVPGVTFYGSGFGHGLGLSQYGANGWATGVTGVPLTGEQIIAKYYPGTALQFVDPSRGFNRVLLSAPSSQGRFVCGNNTYFAGTLADLSSSGGMRVLNEGNANTVIALTTFTLSRRSSPRRARRSAAVTVRRERRCPSEAAGPARAVGHLCQCGQRSPCRHAQPRRQTGGPALEKEKKARAMDRVLLKVGIITGRNCALHFGATTPLLPA